mmetsp:Transcript_31662/g.91559  ORF Transcript_31662/g.91559 Transcript_31662/m.91559 type:complete len:202 (-) Transcript_31662:38-643(-)
MPAPGVLVPSRRDLKAPSRPKTLTLPSESPTTKYFEPCWEAMASAVIAPAPTPSTCNERRKATETWSAEATEAPRNCVSFSKLTLASFRGAAIGPVFALTKTWWTRIVPPLSPVAISVSPFCQEGETASNDTGRSCPALKATSCSPEGARSRTLPLADATTSSACGSAISELFWATKAARSGRNLTRLAGFGKRTTAFFVR